MKKKLRRKISLDLQALSVQLYMYRWLKAMAHVGTRQCKCCDNYERIRLYNDPEVTSPRFSVVHILYTWLATKTKGST